MTEEKPSDHAMNFEAVKIAMSQTKDGVIIRLAIHPNDCPQELHTDWVGSRYMVALVKLQDDDSIAKNKDYEARKKAVAVAATMCRNQKFQEWLVHMGIADSIGEDAAAIGLKESLLIGSRAELATDDVARKKFFELIESFRVDQEGGRI
jgi:hypothetical protein